MNHRKHVKTAQPKRDVVHSGHFMISSVTDDQEEHEDMTLDHCSPIYHERSEVIHQGYDFTNVPKETKDSYQFELLSNNQVAIDGSLARLFQCMSLAYQGGKVISPKWKNFKGLNLTVKDKIRLNNVIWRYWHIQFVLREKRGKSLIQFVTPFELDYHSHSKPEAAVLEGKYWKRRIETVVAEYKKWRGFFANKYIARSGGPTVTESSEVESSQPLDETFLNDFTDTLFTSLSQQPFQFPNPREIAMHATNSDMIQPGLLQLQPNVEDDYMDFDPFQGLFSPPKNPTSPVSGNDFQPVNQLDSFSETDFGRPVLGANQVFPSTRVQTNIPHQQMSNAFGHSATNGDAMKSFPAHVNLQTVNSGQFNSFPQSNGELVSVVPASRQSAVPHQSSNRPPATQILHLPQGDQIVYLSNVKIQQATKQPHSVIAYHPASNTQNSSESNYFHAKKTTNQPVITMTYSQTQATTSFNEPVVQSQAIVNMPQNSTATAQIMQVEQPQLPLQELVSHHSSRGHQRKRGCEFDTAPAANSSSLQNQNHGHGPVNIVSAHPPNAQPVIPEKRRSLEESRLPSQFAIPDSWIHNTKSSNTSSVPGSHVMDVSHPMAEPCNSKESELIQTDCAQKQSISAEQKRRININAGFMRLQKLLPGSSSQGNIKISKANLMNRAVQYIKMLQSDRNKTQEEAQLLKDDINKLQASINSTQQCLPVTGAPLSRARDDQNRIKFNNWLQIRTKEEWRFHIFGLVIQPWFTSYQKAVSTAGAQEFMRTISHWLQEDCSLPILRSSVIQSLQVLCTSTSILSNPSLLQQQIEELNSSDSED